ncbi:flagellar motor switch protein FliG [Alsobacter sp. SYSU M60028]|uniref:Flagellar motor switch protein FliG n=1 Tax=Alsobacter ponti TaxID=2962936 RepID=A0ABT1LDJ4_9HYPH|nr:flagellar motor switch protein FliG [Alsobacter ponti]MCP8939163.1 flagellar motor switch protein FliG [Alsobacter ponti]
MAELARVSRLSGPERAAVLLLVLGEEFGAPIWESLDDEELRQVTLAMSTLGSVSAQNVESVIGELAHHYSRLTVVGDYERTHELLIKLLPRERVDPIMDEIRGPAGKTIWQRLSNVQEGILANYLKTEHPQTVALILSRVRPDHTAKVLSLLPDEFAIDVMLRILQLDNVSKEVMDQVENSLRTNFIANLSQSSRRDAHDTMAEIFNAFDRQNEAKFMEALEANAFKSAEKIRALMFTFDDITRLDPNSAQVLVRSVDKLDLAKALKGASAGTREFFTSKMTQRAAALFLDDMAGLGPIRLKEADEAQQRIIRTAKELAEKGEIIIAKSGSEEDAILE